MFFSVCQATVKICFFTHSSFPMRVWRPNLIHLPNISPLIRLWRPNLTTYSFDFTGNLVLIHLCLNCGYFVEYYNDFRLEII
ncbi:hypothetical protein L1987_79111 [Smallanthus sonchifolius]|uniref:Uncharacterized protein n=1 Tax=Smallanthus sonchifolius TaxID=185202 RepID=A0ACB8ZES8_9ASTR|nr:hypothetical protein L1987_79111 [Smallanthus sonchifolius]